MRVVKSIKLCLAVIGAAVLFCGVILAGLTSGAGQARAAFLPTPLVPPLAAPSAGLKLTQVSAG